MQNSRDKRRVQRFLLGEPVRVSWTDEHENYRFVEAKCLDVSETGIRLLMPVQLTNSCYVNIRADRYRLNVSARVRRVLPKGMNYIIGMEFNGLFRWKQLEATLGREHQLQSV